MDVFVKFDFVIIIVIWTFHNLKARITMLFYKFKERREF